MPTRAGHGLVLLALLALLALAQPAQAQNASCIVESNAGCTLFIDFYSTRFSAFQPDSGGEERFCTALPATGTTIFVLDYLHASLSQVPVEFRIIRDATGKGRFAKWQDVEQLGALETHTVFHLPAAVHADGALLAQHEFLQGGSYLGIVTAGHPSNERLYRAVFAITVGRDSPLLPLFGLGLLALAGLLYRRGWHRAAPGVAASAR